MSTELRRVTYGNHGVARLTPAPDNLMCIIVGLMSTPVLGWMVP